MSTTSQTIYDVIIIGSGPAGYSAAIYSARGNLKTLLITGFGVGGQLCLTDSVENYPGFSRKDLKTTSQEFDGQILMDIMYEQTKELGVEIIQKNVTKVDFDYKASDVDKDLFKIFIKDKEYIAKSVIVSTGATAKKMSVKGFDEFFNKGVSLCATCDGMLFKNKDVMVVGGGNTAVEEAIFLSKICKQVCLIHRGAFFRAEKILQSRLFAVKNITVIWHTELQEICGDQKVKSVKLKTKNNNTTSNNAVTEKNIDTVQTKNNNEAADYQFTEKNIDAVFIAIGHEPNTKIFQEYIECDTHGYINVTNEVQTNIAGVFAAGDVADKEYKQAITAAGSGCKAAMKIIKYLQ